MIAITTSSSINVKPLRFMGDSGRKRSRDARLTLN
jgi:hypothetical protein